MEIDAVKLSFSPDSLQVLNGIIALIMFGVALDMHPRDFKQALKSPRPVLIGLACQFVLLPALAWALSLLLQLSPSVALGLILVAACPGGNFSNFLTHLARGHTAISVTMSSVSTVLAVVMTPLNLVLWGRLQPVSAPLIKQIRIDPSEIVVTVGLILILPLTVGMFTHLRFPRLANRLRKPMQQLSLVFLFAFIVVGLRSNWDVFMNYIGIAFWAVLLTNAAGLAGGYWIARLCHLTIPEARAVSFETGIQNSGLGLILVFAFFDGLGGMAVVAAWWGIWHLISGLLLAVWWRRKPLPA